MGIMDTLLGRKGAPAQARHSKPAPSTQYDSQGGSSQSVRKDLLKLALRETLTRNGIPPTWLSADMLRSSNSKKEAGLHMRFQVRHWDPRLLVHGVALEREFTQRLQMLDPTARTWLMGVSWQYALEDTSACPPLPHASTWTARAKPTDPAPLVTEPVPLPSADVIEGPPIEPRPLEDVRADLEKLLALRDDDARKHAATPGGAFAPTRPATL